MCRVRQRDRRALAGPSSRLECATRRPRSTIPRRIVELLASRSDRRSRSTRPRDAWPPWPSPPRGPGRDGLPHHREDSPERREANEPNDPRSRGTPTNQPPHNRSPTSRFEIEIRVGRPEPAQTQTRFSSAFPGHARGLPERAPRRVESRGRDHSRSPLASREIVAYND